MLIVDEQLYKIGVDQVLCWYIRDHEKQGVLHEAHQGISGGHFVGDEILQIGL